MSRGLGDVYKRQTYDDGMGKCNQLYFKDLQTNSNHMVKVYHALKKSFDKTIMR